MTPRPDAQRLAMTALYRELVGRAIAPKWVTRAFVVAVTDRTDPVEACALAHFGQGLAALGPGGVEAARGWAARLSAARAALAGQRLAA